LTNATEVPSATPKAALRATAFPRPSRGVFVVGPRGCRPSPARERPRCARQISRDLCWACSWSGRGDVALGLAWLPVKGRAARDSPPRPSRGVFVVGPRGCRLWRFWPRRTESLGAAACGPVRSPGRTGRAVARYVARPRATVAHADRLAHDDPRITELGLLRAQPRGPALDMSTESRGGLSRAARPFPGRTGDHRDRPAKGVSLAAQPRVCAAKVAGRQSRGARPFLGRVRDNRDRPRRAAARGLTMSTQGQSRGRQSRGARPFGLRSGHPRARRAEGAASRPNHEHAQQRSREICRAERGLSGAEPGRQRRTRPAKGGSLAAQPWI
jgi:hypothetical protein